MSECNHDDRFSGVPFLPKGCCGCLACFAERMVKERNEMLKMLKSLADEVGSEWAYEIEEIIAKVEAE